MGSTDNQYYDGHCHFSADANCQAWLTFLGLIPDDIHIAELFNASHIYCTLLHAQEFFINFMIILKFFVPQIVVITSVWIYSVIIKIPKFMVFLSYGFMESCLNTSFILKIRLYLNVCMTFDKQVLSDKINQVFKTNYIQYQLVHHSIVSDTLLSKHLTALQLGFYSNIYT